MSTLVKKLKDSALAGGPPLGFKTRKAAAVPPLVLVASLSPGAGLSTALRGADAVLVEAETAASAKHLGPAAKELGAVPWGVMLKRMKPEESKLLRDAGCDFVVMRPDDAPASVLKEDEPGKVLLIPATIDEGMAAAVNDLRVDAVLIQGAGGASLTVLDVLSIQRLTDILDMPVLAFVPAGIVAAELEAVKSTGLAGVVLPIDPAQAEARIAQLRQAISQLPRETRRRPEKRSALLPQAGEEEALLSEEDEP